MAIFLIHLYASVRILHRWIFYYTSCSFQMFFLHQVPWPKRFLLELATNIYPLGQNSSRTKEGLSGRCHMRKLPIPPLPEAEGISLSSNINSSLLEENKLHLLILHKCHYRGTKDRLENLSYFHIYYYELQSRAP